MPSPSEPASAASRFHYFFDLPPELRLQILTSLCHSPFGYSVGPDPEANADGLVDLFDRAPLPVEVPLNLFLASIQLYREASAVFYETNTFYITLTPKRKHCISLLEGSNALFSLKSAALATRRRMRSVTLWYVPFSNPCHSSHQKAKWAVAYQ